MKLERVGEAIGERSTARINRSNTFALVVCWRQFDCCRYFNRCQIISRHHQLHHRHLTTKMVRLIFFFRFFSRFWVCHFRREGRGGNDCIGAIWQCVSMAFSHCLLDLRMLVTIELLFRFVVVFRLCNDDCVFFFSCDIVAILIESARRIAAYGVVVRCSAAYPRRHTRMFVAIVWVVVVGTQRHCAAADRWSKSVCFIC